MIRQMVFGLSKLKKSPSAWPILLRRGFADQWDEFDPVLADGEVGLDLTRKRLKIGNGADKWTELPFATPEEVYQLLLQAY